MLINKSETGRRKKSLSSSLKVLLNKKTTKERTRWSTKGKNFRKTNLKTSPLSSGGGRKEKRRTKTSTKWRGEGRRGGHLSTLDLLQWCSDVNWRDKNRKKTT